MPSPVGPRQGHLASGAMHPPLLHFSFSLYLSLTLRTRLIYRIAPLQLPRAMYKTLAVSLPPVAHGQARQVTHSYSPFCPYPPSVLPATSLLAFELSRDSSAIVARSSCERDASLLSFIPLTLALFSLSLLSFSLCRYKYLARCYF